MSIENPDLHYIQRCIHLAQKAIGHTYPNPMVGAVIVHQGNIIGEGYHHKAGEAHAEINAINAVKQPELLPEATIYVSLEPCSHFGKTPPCALKLKEIGFKRVVIGAMDSHEKVNGKGKKILEEAGIEVISGVLEKECQELNKRFFTYHQKQRPFIILKWAESADGFIDQDFKPTIISNPLASQWVHRLRANENAILVGTQTALTDNPSLTVRHIEGNNPVRILIDFDLKVPTHFNIFNTEAPTLIFNGVKNEVNGHLKYIKIEREHFLEQLMQHLHQEQIQSIIIEGGKHTLEQFIHAHLWDEAFVIKNQNLILKHGTPAPKLHLAPNKTETIRDNTIEFYYNEV